MANYKCSACGGDIAFNPATQKLVCEHCLTAYSSIEEKTPGLNEDYNSYDCLSCGAKLVADKTTIATECAFCGSNVVLSDKTNTYTRPEFILPFLIDKDKAMGLFRDFCNKEKLTPREITKQSKISRMQGVYVPAWFFSTNADSTLQFECSTDEIKVVSAKRMASIFDVVMRGFARFDKIPVNASSYVNSRFIESIEPFECNKLTPFDNKYIMGFLADYSDISSDKCLKTAENRIVESVSAVCKKMMKRYAEIKLKNSSVAYNDYEKNNVLIPVWFLNIQYKKEKYCFTINGQTGKIAGVLPMSNLARKIIYILMAALIISLVTGLSLLTGPLGAVIVFVATVFFAVQGYRKKALVDDKVYHLKGRQNADTYIVDNSVDVSEVSTAYIKEEEIIGRV